MFQLKIEGWSTGQSTGYAQTCTRKIVVNHSVDRPEEATAIEDNS